MEGDSVPVPDTSTAPLFVALASVLAAIEAGTIEEGEVESHRINDDADEVYLTVTVRSKVRPHPALRDEDD